MKAKKSVPRVSSAQRKLLLKSLQSSAEPADVGQKQTKYRVVVDTSTLVGAIFYGGKSLEVFRHVLSNQQFVTSDFIIDELIQFAKNTNPKTPRKFIKLLRDQFEPYVKEYEVSEKVVIRDINDTDVIQLAIAESALIVASDKDLQVMKNSQVVVLSPSEYYELFIQ